MKDVEMSQNATLATQNEATRRLEPLKMTAFCRTRHRRGHVAFTRTDANGCGRLRTVADANATSSEHTLNPQTPRMKREPLPRIREKSSHQRVYWDMPITVCLNGFKRFGVETW